MDYSVNEIISYYANASIEYVNILTNAMPPGGKDGRRTTAPGVSGLVIPLSGSAYFSFNGRTYEMKEQDIVHAGPQMDLGIETIGNESWEYAVVHYQTWNQAPLDLHTKDFLLKVKQTAKIKEYVYELMRLSAEPGNYMAFQSKTVFFNLLNELLLQGKRYQGGCQEGLVPRAIAYIHEHYENDLSVGELANMLEMERRRFSELFERHTGLPPVQYITEYRIRIARELLRGSGLSIAEIAEKSGYHDTFYFSRVFKKQVGMAPSAYRKYIAEHMIYM